MKIDNLLLQRLVNASHLQYMTDADALLSVATFKADITAEYTIFKSALTVEAESQKNELGSAATRLIVDADELRDSRYNGFYLVVEGNMSHFDAAIAESARKVSRILDQFGDPVKLPYNDETSVLNSIIASLETTLAADITKLGLTTWVANIKKVNADFAKLMTDRRDEFAGRVIPPMKETRVVTDAAYKKMVERINALAIVKGEAAYLPVMNKLNESIAYFRNSMAIKDGKAKAGEQAAAKTVQAVN
jgi:hypothetical protein